MTKNFGMGEDVNVPTPCRSAQDHPADITNLLFHRHFGVAQYLGKELEENYGRGFAQQGSSFQDNRQGFNRSYKERQLQLTSFFFNFISFDT